MGKIVQEVKVFAAPVVEKHGCELWDIEYVKEAGQWYLRIYIDHPDGVSINHCETISRELDPILDERENLIPGGYTFEVSSAGAERWLRGPSDFERFSGRPVEVKLYKPKDGQKAYTGNLSGWTDDGVELEIDGRRQSFEKAEVAGVKLIAVFDRGD